MHIDQSHEKVELINDIDVKRDTWEAYFLYLEYLDDFLARLTKVEDKDEVKQNKGIFFPR